MTRISLRWAPRWPPLAPAAVAAFGPAAASLAERLLAGQLAGQLAEGRLNGVATPEGIVITGAADALPWSDGAFYLGRDPAAPQVLIPTNRAPSIAPHLIELALRSRHPDLTGSLAIWPLDGGLRVVSLAGVRPIAGSALRSWLRGAR